MKIYHTVIWFFLVTTYSSYAQTTEQAKESFYQQLTRLVIRLQNPSTENPLGTAFFVIHRRDNKHYYVVTARHVVEKRLDVKARVPSQLKDSGKTEIIELRIPRDQWFFHPDSTRKTKFNDKEELLFPVDVAIAKLPAIADRRIRALAYCPLPCSPDEKESQFLSSDPEPPTRVIVWGFPVDIGFTLDEQRPLGRLGLIAMVANEPFIRTNGILRDERVFLLDAPIFPGNSGGPVLTFPVIGKTRLAGLISASNPKLGFAIAEPVSRIAEVLDIAFVDKAKPKASWRLIRKTTGGRPDERQHE